MTVYPIEIDSSLNLPAAVNGVSPVNAQAVNQLRDAVIAIESELGVKPSGVYGTVKEALETLSSDMQNVIITVDDAIATMQASIDDSIISIQQDLTELADGGVIFIAGGDLDGNGISQTVIGIQGVSVSATAPSDQQVLVYDGGTLEWAPGTVNSFVAAGDLSGDNTSQTVIQIQGRPVASTVPDVGDVYVWGGAEWAPGVAAIQLPAVYELSLCSGLESTDSLVFIRIGARIIDLTAFPATAGTLTRTITFEIDVDMTATATSVEVQLYDSTHSVIVTGTNLTSSSTTNATLSAVLTVGSSAGNLRNDVASHYELQLKMNGGLGADFVFCTNARLIISYA